MFDASHGFGCSLRGNMLGSFGDCEVFSFHATKFFNTFEGGAVVTGDDDLAEKMRLMRNFGFVDYDKVIYPGTNGKMTEVSAAMGLTNLGEMDRFVAGNRRNFHCYQSEIATIPGLALLPYDEQERNNYQYIVVEVGPNFATSRDRTVQALHAENVLARKYFWPGCHNMQPYRAYYPNAGLVLPNTKQVADRVVVMPTGTGNVNRRHRWHNVGAACACARGTADLGLCLRCPAYGSGLMSTKYCLPSGESPQFSAHASTAATSCST